MCAVAARLARRPAPLTGHAPRPQLQRGPRYCALPQTAARAPQWQSGQRGREARRCIRHNERLWARVQRQRCHCCGGIVVSAPFTTRAAAFTPMAFVPVLLRHPGGACAPTPQSEHILEVRVATSIVRCTAMRCTTALVHVAPQQILAKVCCWVPSSRETRGLAVKPRYGTHSAARTRPRFTNQRKRALQKANPVGPAGFTAGTGPKESGPGKKSRCCGEY